MAYFVIRQHVNDFEYEAVMDACKNALTRHTKELNCKDPKGCSVVSFFESVMEQLKTAKERYDNAYSDISTAEYTSF